MPPSEHRRPRTARLVVAAALAIVVCAVGPMAEASVAVTAVPRRPPATESRPTWEWPLHPARVVARFVAPAHAYGPGHRGIDIAPVGSDREVVAPEAGTVAFAGSVGGRGVVTIDHGAGLVTTLEPVTPAVSPGAVVRRGGLVAHLGVGGHAVPGTLHMGVRRDGEYIDPLLLLGGVPRAVLLPCCA